jgi:hypothetical protein
MRFYAAAMKEEWPLYKSLDPGFRQRTSAVGIRVAHVGK